MINKKKMFCLRFFIFTIIILLTFCKDPYLPQPFAPPIITEEEKKVVFEFDGELLKTENCHITGCLINAGTAIAYHCHGEPKAYADLNRTTEIQVSCGGNWLMNRTFNPGDKEYFDMQTVEPFSCEEIKVFEATITFNHEDDIWGEPETQVIYYIFN